MRKMNYTDFTYEKDGKTYKMTTADLKRGYTGLKRDKDILEERLRYVLRKQSAFIIIFGVAVIVALLISYYVN